MRQRLGKYELVTLLSVGGMAELHLAFAPGPGGFRKVVALKHVLPDLKSDERFIKMFLDEARLTAALTHPNIGQVFDLGDEDGELYLAMEFIPGVTLNKVLLRAGKLQERLPAPFSCRVVRDAALALHHAHSFKDPATGAKMPIIHRDVTPNNVMVTFDGVVKVIDFGIAKARGRLVRTQKGMLKGTLPYMAPEQLLGRESDARSDLFSLGVVLWELLAGRELFFAATLPERVKEPVIPLEQVADVPAELAAVVMKALAEDPAARFSSTREFARALEAAAPSIAHEEQLASVVTRLFPDTRGLLDRLLAMTQQQEVDEAAITALVKRLRRSEQDPGARRSTQPMQGAPQRVVATWDADAAPDPAPPPEPSPEFSATGLVTVALVAVIALVGGMAWWASKPEEKPVVVSEATRVTFLQVRGALADRDPLAAQGLLDGCRDQGAPCAGLEAVAAETRAMLEAATCGSDAKARERVAAAERAQASGDVAAAKELLVRCTAGRVQHPLASAALARLEAPPPRKEDELAPLEKTHPAVLDLYEEAQKLVEAKKDDEAVERLELCTKADPRFFHCYRLLGDVWARQAANGSPWLMGRARSAYVDYLRRAPPDEEHVEEVRTQIERLK